MYQVDEQQNHPQAVQPSGEHYCRSDGFKLNLAIFWLYDPLIDPNYIRVEVISNRLHNCFENSLNFSQLRLLIERNKLLGKAIDFVYWEVFCFY